MRNFTRGVGEGRAGLVVEVEGMEESGTVEDGSSRRFHRGDMFTLLLRMQNGLLAIFFLRQLVCKFDELSALNHNRSV